MIFLIILKLFFQFLKIGAFSFGGGMATLPYIYEMSERTTWIDENAITNILTVSQITPGPLACNIGTVVGFNVHGILGSIIANIAFVTPAIIFMGIGYKLYKKIQNNEKANEIIKIVRSAALAILITSSLSIFKNAFFYETQNLNIKTIIFLINFKSVILGICLYLSQKKIKINSIYMLLISALIAGIIKI